MPNFTYVRNVDPNDHTGRITVGNHSIGIGQYANLTPEEAAQARSNGRYVIEEGIIPPATEGGAASGVAYARLGEDGTVGGPSGSPLLSSVVSSSFVNLRASDFPTESGSTIIKSATLIQAMEEQNKGVVIPFGWSLDNPNVLCNKVHVSAPLLAAFQYRFYSMGPRAVLKATMGAGDAMFRFNQNAAGEKVNEALYPHADVIFEGIAPESTTGEGRFATAFNRTFEASNISFSHIGGGFANKGFSDVTKLSNITGDHTIPGFLWEGENGDGQSFENVQAYGGRALHFTHGSGTVKGAVGGEFVCVEAKVVFFDDHLEGDGPNEAGGKAQNALIRLQGGDYVLNFSRLSTLTAPNRAAVEVDDSGAPERCTNLTMIGLRFTQRLDNPANPTGRVEPIGNLQGVAINFACINKRAIVKAIDCYGEIFQQTSEESQFDVRQRVAIKITAQFPATATLTNGGLELTEVTKTAGRFEVGQTVTGTGIPASTMIAEAKEVTAGKWTLVLSNKATAEGVHSLTVINTALNEQFTNRRVQVSSADWTLRYNTSTASPEIRPAGGMQDSVTTRRFSQPAINLSQFAVGTAEAKAAPTTLTAGKLYYRLWALDDRGHKTQLSAEKSLNLAEGATPSLQIELGYAARYILERSKVEGNFAAAEWMEGIAPTGFISSVADMGNAAGGQEWTKLGEASKQTGLTSGTAPTTESAQNNTAFGYQGLDTNGRFQGWGSRPTTGEWQKEGDSWTLATGAREHCTVAAAANNGGTWIAG